MIRYQLALLGHSQRYLPSVLAFLVLLAVLYNDPGAPKPPEFAVSAAGLAVVACWLTIALVDAEDPVQRLITLVHARRLSTMLGGVVLSVLACAAGLTVVSLVWAAFTHGGGSVAEFGLGALAHLACACAGIAVGLPCSRLLVPRIGYTVIGALLALSAVLLVRWFPLVNPMLRAMAANSSSPAPTLLGLLASLLALAASSAVVATLLRRRS